MCQVISSISNELQAAGNVVGDTLFSMAQSLNRKCFFDSDGRGNEEPGAGAGVEIRVMARKAEAFPGWSSEQKCFSPWPLFSSFKAIWWNLEWLFQKYAGWEAGIGAGSCGELHGPGVEREITLQGGL